MLARRVGDVEASGGVLVAKGWSRSFGGVSSFGAESTVAATGSSSFGDGKGRDAITGGNSESNSTCM